MGEGGRKDKLILALEKDRARLIALQGEIRKKEQRLKELEQTEIMASVGVLRAKGININEILTAIQLGDLEKLQLFAEKTKEQ